MSKQLADCDGPYIIARDITLLEGKDRVFLSYTHPSKNVIWTSSPDTATTFATYDEAVSHIDKLPPKLKDDWYEHVAKLFGKLFVCQLSQAHSYDPHGLQSELNKNDSESISAAQKACERLHGGKPQSDGEYLVGSVQALIVETCDEIKSMLLSKNKAYGNSALDPVRIFSKCSAREQILVRIDDKLSRIQRGSSLGEDTIKDLIGYLVLLRVAEKMETK